jgi:hypothetical protein
MDECSMRGRNENAHKILVGKLNGREHLGNVGVDAWILLKWTSKKLGWNDVEWIYLAQDRDQDGLLPTRH